MQTNITLDDSLVRRAQELTGIKTKSKAVQEALRALITIHEQAEPGAPDAKMQPQEAVSKSLERSLQENAAIWSELAKH